jgi:hypothetical protein
MPRIEIRDVRCDLPAGKAGIRIFSVSLLFFILLFSSCVAENETAIMVNGDNIYRDEFDYALSRYEDSYRKHFGENIDGAVRDRVRKEMIDDLVSDQLYLQEAKRKGITAKTFAGEEEIEELLMSKPQTSPETEGKRDRAEKVILAYKMRELIPPKVIAAIKEDVTESDTGFLDEYRKRAEKMMVRYLAVDPVAIANNMEISEDDIRSYYKSNSERFRRPAAKEYAVLYFDPYEYAGMVTITPKMLEDYYKENLDDMKSNKLARVKYVLFRTKDYARRIYDVGVNLRKYYEDNLDQFIEPAEARISMITLKKPCNWSKMRGLESGLKQGITFADLAKQYSDDAATAANGGDLGYIKKGTLKEPYNGIAFGLADGQVSGIIETDNGYCVVSVYEKKEAHILPFEEVSVKIEEKLLNEAAKPLALADAKRFKIDAKKNGFEKAAMKKGATVFETDLFNSGDRIPTIGRNLLFTSTALGLASEEVSNEIEYDEGYAVLKVIDIKPAENLPFTDVSGRIESRIIKEDSLVYAENAARHALNLISEGVPLRELENRMSVHITTIEVSSTYESPSNIGEITKKSDGYYVTLLVSEEPSYIPSFDRISYEVAAAVAMDKADRVAGEKADQILKSGAVTKDPSVSTAPFSRNDYIVDREYMRPFIEQCFLLNAGQTGIVKSLGKYYIVQVIERGMDIPGYKDESAVIKSQVLKEKRAEYADDWLKKEREKAQVQINI